MAENVPIRTVYVAPIEPEMKDDIEWYFERFGKVQKFRFCSSVTGFEYCFVQFETAESAKEALKNQNHRIRNVKVKVKAAHSHHQPDSENYVKMIHVGLPLTKDDVELNESTNASNPIISGSKEVSPTDPNNIDELHKCVRDLLNKLTPENIEPLLEQLQALNLDTNEKLLAVTGLVFEKAIDEPYYLQAYAQLCKKLSKAMEEKEKNELSSGEKSNKDTKTAVFRKELLNKCRLEFNTYVVLVCKKLKPLHTELNETSDSNRKLELTMQLKEEERKLHRRSVGIVRFIGELYRQNMLLTSIMEWCVMVLLCIRTEGTLECVCELIKIVGQKMELKTGDREYDKKYYCDLTPHFQTMQQIASDKEQSKISGRVRSMLLDIIELRKNKWVPLPI